jgi:hypothetical protein
MQRGYEIEGVRERGRGRERGRERRRMLVCGPHLLMSR